MSHHHKKDMGKPKGPQGTLHILREPDMHGLLEAWQALTIL